MFGVTLQQMMTIFIFVVLGYVINKAKILPENSDITLARIETFLFVPALTLSSELKYCNPQSLVESLPRIICGSVIIFVFLVLSYPLSRLFVRNISTDKDAYKRRIFQYAITFGNYGFVGDFIILGIFGEQALFEYKMFCFGVGIACSSWGLYILIPKNKNSSTFKNIKKGLLAPPMIALVVGIILGVLNLKQYIPEVVINFLSRSGDCQGPVAMVLAGVVISKYKLKEIFFGKKVFVITFLRLILIPAIIMLVMYLFNIPKAIMILALICFATPIGLNTIVYPATYNGDTKVGASMTAVSSIFSVITIPIMYYVFIELL